MSSISAIIPQLCLYAPKGVMDAMDCTDLARAVKGKIILPGFAAGDIEVRIVGVPRRQMWPNKQTDGHRK
uniref:Uncharacterized protein n=1 Tax=Magallana gigas TaxID=29159 RepID=K1PP98_MAGGI